MNIKQLSVFLENKTGRINDVTRALARHGINMHAFSMAESGDFGILRLIVSDTEKAVAALRTENFAVIETEVVCISCANTAGSLAPILDALALEGVFIEYMYAFSHGARAYVVIRPTDNGACVRVLQKAGCDVLEADTL